MLDWTGAPCIDTLGILCVSDIPISVVFIVADESINTFMICSASASSLTLIDGNGVKFDAGLPLFWCH